MSIVLIWLFFSIATAIVAGSKGRNVFGWLLLGCLFSLLALILVAILPSKKTPAPMSGGEVATPDTHIRCPDCKELVRKDANVCWHCHCKLTPQLDKPAKVELVHSKAVAILGAVLVFAFGSWMVDKFSTSSPQSTPATAEERADYAKQQRELEAQVAASEAARIAKFTAERASVISTAKSLLAQRKYQQLVDMDNDYAWAHDAELDRITATARDKVSAAAIAYAMGKDRVKPKN